MPVLNNDATSLTFTMVDETWIIAPWVTVSQGTFTNFANSTLINHGTLYDSSDQGVFFLAAATGQIVNEDSGIIGGVNAVAIQGPGGVAVTNRGEIFGTDHGIHMVSSGNNVNVVNSGDIFGVLGGVTASSGNHLNVKITNSGLIESDQHGIWLLNAFAAAVIVNSGTVRGDTNSILAESGDRLNVTNTGSLFGHVRGTSVNQVDSVTNNGAISGHVLLGSGSDVYKGSGLVTGTVLGEAGGDSLAGGKLADRLNGGGGNDLLNGGAGVDTLTGGPNNDVFLFNAPLIFANRDTITDFVAVNDTMRLENAFFTKLPAGPLHPTMFKLSTQAKDANDFIQYNKATGALIYDSNGSGIGGAVHFATLSTKPAISHLDFQVI